MSRKSMLIWRCRRGMKELDMLLRGYLDNFYDSAPVSEQRVFERLLTLQDPDLYNYFTGRDHAEDTDVQALVERIRQRTFD
jgi:antitoxin CptB